MSELQNLPKRIGFLYHTLADYKAGASYAMGEIDVNDHLTGATLSQVVSDFLASTQGAAAYVHSEKGNSLTEEQLQELIDDEVALTIMVLRDGVTG